MCNAQLSALRQQVLNDITVLMTGCHNTDALKTSSKQLIAAIMAMRTMQSTSGTQSEKFLQIETLKNSSAFFRPKRNQLAFH